jgi:hypothetical protein
MRNFFGLLWAIATEKRPQQRQILPVSSTCVNQCWAVFIFLGRTYKVFSLVLKMKIGGFHIMW